MTPRSADTIPPPRPAVRVTHALAGGAFGGLETVVTALALAQSRRGLDVSALLIRDADEPEPLTAQTLGESGIRLATLSVPLRAYVKERRGIREQLVNLGPEVVHCHGYRADLQALTVARRLHIPCVSTVHGFTGGDLKLRLYEWLEERALRRADAVAAVSEPIRRRLLRSGVPEDRLVLIRNGWRAGGELLTRPEARSVLGLDPADFVVGWVGRLSPEKGPDVMAAAAREVPDAVVCFVGDGAMRARLADARAHSGAQLHFAGVHPQAGRLFRAFDVLALSSHTEGTPMVLLEAMHAQVPIVATRVGGVPDMLGPSEAWLVPPGEPRELARAIADVQVHPDEAASRARAAARRVAKAFSLDQTLDAYERLYEDAIRRRRRTVSESH